MIRRLFWVAVGAVAGVAGYRRLTALARSLPQVARLGSLTGFAADVREGMAIYMERHQGRGSPTLEAHAGCPASGEPAGVHGLARPGNATAPPRPGPGAGTGQRGRPITDDTKDGS